MSDDGDIDSPYIYSYGELTLPLRCARCKREGQRGFKLLDTTTPSIVCANEEACAKRTEND